MFSLYRELLSDCRDHLKSLEWECSELERRVGEGEVGGAGGVANCGLLRAQLVRVRGEIVREEEVEKQLTQKLKVSSKFTNQLFCSTVYSVL